MRPRDIECRSNGIDQLGSEGDSRFRIGRTCSGRIGGRILSRVAEPTERLKSSPRRHPELSSNDLANDAMTARSGSHPKSLTLHQCHYSLPGSVIGDIERRRRETPDDRHRGSQIGARRFENGLRKNSVRLHQLE